MTAVVNNSTENDNDKISEVEIVQEGSESISEVFLVDSDVESENAGPPVNISSPDPLAVSTFGPSSIQAHNVLRNLGRLSKIQRFHDLPCSSKSQCSTSDYALYGEKLQSCEVAGLCEAKLTEFNEEDGLQNHSKLSTPSRISRRPRQTTQRSKNNLCRLCEQHSYALTNIFGKSGNTSNIIEKIHLHLPITVHKNDKLPQGICGLCLQALKTFHDLYQTSLSTDCNLRETFLKDESTKFYSYQEADESSSPALCNDKSSIDNQDPSSSSDTPFFQQDKLSSEPTKVSKTISRRSIVESVHDVLLNQHSDSSDNDDGDDVLMSLNPEVPLQHTEEENEEPSSSLELEKRTCDICQETFSSKVDMKKHRSDHSAEERLKCKVCEKIMPNDKSYQSHMKTHSHKVHLCPKCGKVLATASTLRNHLLVHEDPKFCCQICGKTTRTIAKLEDHMVTHSDKRDWECEKCGQKFKLKANLKQHMSVHSQVPKFVCHLCGYAVHRHSHLRYHMSSHHNPDGDGKLRTELKYPCDLCNMKYMKKFNLVRHQVAAHGAKPAVIVGETKKESQETRLPVDALCAYCNIQFPNKEALKSHKIEVHYRGSEAWKKNKEGWKNNSEVPRKELPCPHCGKHLSSKRSFDNHVRSHTGERPFLCSICGESFKSADIRQRHEWKHTNNRPFKCTVCDKAFFAYATLYQHKQVHIGDKQFKCNYCTYKTCRAAALKVHLRVHTNEKPYECNLCDRKYKSSWDLKLHSRVHTGEARSRRIRSKPKEVKLQEKPVVYEIQDVLDVFL